MRKCYALLIITVLLFSACTSEFKQFQQEAYKAARDGKLNRKEFLSLVNLAASSKDENFRKQCYLGDKLDTGKVAEYLSKYLAAKGISFSSIQLWPGNIQLNPGPANFNINVYLENSASMDGYVNRSTAFKNDIYALLGDLSLNRYCDSLNLKYINNAIHPIKLNATADDIRTYIETLTPATFRARGGNRSESDLRAVISDVLAHTNNKNASILISDFVFSPGRKVNAHDYLADQSIGIKIDVAHKLQQFDLAVEVLQMNSLFTGYYYDEYNTPVLVCCNRPYYIWIIGNSAQLKAIITSKVVDHIPDGCQNRLVVQAINNGATPDYKILHKDKTGSFLLADGARGAITRASPSDQPRTAGIFAFSVAVDFSSYIQDPAFFVDTTNYEHNRNYSFSVNRITDTSDLSTRGFTHELRFSTRDLHNEIVNVLVKGHAPSWVAKYSSDSDLNIKTDRAEQQRTFGLTYLVNGLCNAFYQNPGSNTLGTLKIIIK